MNAGPAAGTAASPGGGSGVVKYLPLILIVAAIWLAWQIILGPIAQRAPPAMAIRVAPASPDVLGRAAEAEVLAGRPENGRRLAGLALSKAPFNVRAMRVFGLIEAENGRLDTADGVLTLAGNWSLRDDPAHAWLVQQRLRQGNYVSALAHADTLARRQVEHQPQVFRLFTAAALADPRAVGPLVGLLSKNPPWRLNYIRSLYKAPENAPLIAALAINLEATPAPFDSAELQLLYNTWVREGRLDGLALIRQRLGRPPLVPLLVNGAFAETTETPPFAWVIGVGPGVQAGITADDLNPRESALRIQYDGFASTGLARQFLLLRPGAYTLTGAARIETAPDEPRMIWTVSCSQTGAELGRYVPSGSEDPARWASFSLQFVVPAERCAAQWLRLEPRSGDRRSTVVAWFDRFQITRTDAAATPR